MDANANGDPSPATAGTGMPRIHAGRRRGLLRRLVINGAAQALVAFAMAWALREGLDEARHGVLDAPLVALLGASGLALLALRAQESSDAERLGQDYVMRVRLRLFRRVAARPLGGGGRRRFGVTMTRMISDLNSLRNWVSVGIARMLVSSVTVAGLLVAACYFGATIGAVVAGMVVVCALMGAVLTPLLRGYVREARRRRGRLANNLGEKLLASRTVHHFGRTRPELARVRSHSRSLRDALVRRVRVAALLRSLPTAAHAMALAGLVALTASLGHAIADVAVTILLLGLVTSSIGDIARAWDYRLSFEEGRRRIDEVLAGPQLSESRHAIELGGTGPLALRLRGVRVGDALGPFDLEAAAGERVRLEGATGSGKSTLLALAARLRDPDAGTVELDGHDVRTLALDSLHEAVQLVSPDLPLLRGSVASNLGYGLDDDAEDGWLDRVAKACGLLEAPPLREEGLQTRLEERAENVPHGLRARIALARAAALRPRLLLVDDPAFVIDSAARRALEEIVALLGCTVLFVATGGEAPLPADRVWRLGAREAAPLVLVPPVTSSPRRHRVAIVDGGHVGR